ncbi:MAG: hypothetical protein AAGA77_15685 [Bacteroidota bacterium]
MKVSKECKVHFNKRIKELIEKNMHLEFFKGDTLKLLLIGLMENFTISKIKGLTKGFGLVNENKVVIIEMKLDKVKGVI